MEFSGSKNYDDIGTRVSLFENSAENHFRIMDVISKLSGETNIDPPEEIEIQREWHHFFCRPRSMSFACEMESKIGDDFHNQTELPRFSSTGRTSTESSSDFVMNVGGSVWALDWLPKFCSKLDSYFNCEFVAVSAHPPDSYLHKMGVSLTGSGLIQIWCVLNINRNREFSAPLEKRKQGALHNKWLVDQRSETDRKNQRSPKTQETEKFLVGANTNDNLTQFRRPRGRPRKNLVKESNDMLLRCDKHIQNPSGQYSDQSKLAKITCAFDIIKEHCSKQLEHKSRRCSMNNTLLDESNESDRGIVCDRKSKRLFREKSARSDRIQEMLTGNEDERCLASSELYDSSGMNPGMVASVLDDVLLDADPTSSSLKDNVVLPRVVFCLAHDGKVAWDLKWRPELSGCKFQHRMGYLAVLLGDGSLEVWDVPHPNIMKFIYSSCHEDGSDPRFVKLKPIFRCSSLKCGDVKSIPLTVEWSPTPPNDCLLAGCHDGRVALWKFSSSDSNTSSDTRPLLSFMADTVPIRAVAWAPFSSDQEASNVIVTAGHGGLKFWTYDYQVVSISQTTYSRSIIWLSKRDPFRPLWSVALKKFIYSLDWPPDLRCIILSCDDGKMRLLSLVKAAYDAPVSEDGKASVGPKQQGLHEIYCSSSAIWCVHVSRLTDGTVCCFQLTDKAVGKDPSRHRAPHFVCGSLDVSKSTIIVSTPLVQAALKKPNKYAPENPKSMREFLWKSNKERVSKDEQEHITCAASDVEPLATCCSEDPDAEHGYSENPTALITPSAAGGTETQALVCVHEEQGKTRGMEIEEAANKEGKPFPPKVVAMHRVRWNLNRGSERWLCTGGAAGLVRCQQIMLV